MLLFQEHDTPGLYLIIHKAHPRKGKYENKNLTNLLFGYKEVNFYIFQFSQENKYLKENEIGQSGGIFWIKTNVRKSK